MSGSRSLLSALCFAGLAALAAVVAARLAAPAVTPLLLAAVAAGTIAGLPGLVRRRAWPAALLLLPLGAYLLARAHVPLPPQTDGAGAHLAFYAGRLQAGALAYFRQVFPLDVGGEDELRLLLALVAYVVAWAAAFVALSLRRPLAGIVILLIVVGFGFTIDSSPRDLWPALGFVLLAAALLAASGPRGGERRSRVTDVFAGGAVAAVAAALALAVLGTTAVDAGQPLKNWREWEVGRMSTADLSFDFMQNYPELLDPAQNVLVMRVFSPVPSYWQANVLDTFDGSGWRSTLPADRELRALRRFGSWVYAVPPARPTPEGAEVTQRFEIRGTYVDRLPAGGQPTVVRSVTRLRLDLTDAGALTVTPSRGPAFSYTLNVLVPRLEAADLVARGRDYPEDVAQTYLGLPFPALRGAGAPVTEAEWRAATAATPGGEEWLDLYDLNARIVGDETDPYRIALAIERYLRGNYGYELRPPDAGYDSPYAEFLFATRLGYCQHFAGAMAALLRFNGIPARVAVGFATGQRETQGVWAVSRNDAHAWVEAYFPGTGWAPFEPTPGRQNPNASGAVADGSDAAAAAGVADPDAASPLAQPELEAEPERATDAEATGADGDSTAATTFEPRSLWPLALLLILVVWPLGRALLRRRGLARGPHEARLRAATALLRADLRDHGVEVPASSTLDETAAWLHEDLDVDAGELLARVQAIEFGGRAASDADLRELAALRRRVRRRLRERFGRFVALLALYGLRPPSGGAARAAPLCSRP